ncbi:uncharacterized protein Dyak_GE27295 [Drosophila yakuba]|uniref:Secreted protein n=1 Tax=Drosophila yakuba TaxID=7245 RepID=A0A0R1DTA2_DROYA|nr:uncharacterized protein Dyak_GE27295 [Drosophila yakuba]
MGGVAGQAPLACHRLLATAICLACQSAPAAIRSSGLPTLFLQGFSTWGLSGGKESNQCHISSFSPPQMQQQSVAPLKRVCVVLHHQQRQQKQICIVSCIAIRDGS